MSTGTAILVGLGAICAIVAVAMGVLIGLVGLMTRPPKGPKP